ncbi:MAG TPA: xanthine dehydrogenase family protein molybdopterin-binding subunit, partial [Myxococcaceae bacterium]|nr:xanthine dehydrogenase family protein molybdopterin-binding subunit [Myxococcaceae bacterium]
MTATSRVDGRWVGSRVRRKEDSRLLMGRGTFVADLDRVGLLHAAFARSPVAAGEIRGIELEPAHTSDGVRAAFSGETLGIGGLTAILERPEFTPTTMPILAVDRVRYVGEPVAVVVAETPYAAEDGVERVHVDYAETRSISSIAAALAEGTPSVHPELARNTFLDLRMFDDPGIDELFRTNLVVSSAVRSGRVTALPMEGRACLAEWSDRDEQLVLHVSTQVPHLVRSAVARCLRLPERQVRVVAPDVGGGFGLKCVIGREEIAVAAVAHRLRRPVRWIEDRQENLTASFQGHEQEYDVRAAFDREGRLRALDGEIRCDVGAYSVFPFTCGVEPLMAATELPGAYRVPRYRIRARAIASNKPPTAPYRGVSRPQIVLVMERLMERAARLLGMDPLEVRRRNLIDEFPYSGVNGVTYDPGSYRASLDLCEQVLREDGWYALRDRAAEEGRRIGIGYSCFNERTGYGTSAFAQRKMQFTPGYDIARVRMDPSGTVVVASGTSSHGQGHETTLAQIAADQLGMHVDSVRVRQGDTELVPYGWGTFASRSAVIGGGAVYTAAGRLAEKLRRIAAHLLEAAASDVELLDGGARVVGSPRSAISFAELARISHFQSHLLPNDVEAGLEAEASFDVEGSGTFSNATHGVVAEIDPGTGDVRLLRYLVVEDCGVIINPQIVDGQVRG